MKNTILALLVVLLPSLMQASSAISGTAIRQDTDISLIPDISLGESYVYLVDLDGSAFSTNDLLTLDAGLSLTDSSTYSGFSVIGNGTVEPVFGAASVGSGLSVDLSGEIDAGYSFGILVFDNSLDITLGSDTFSIFTDDSWELLSDGDTGIFGNQFTQIGPGTGPAVIGSVGAPIPEPSAYALFVAFLSMGYVVASRSRSRWDCKSKQ